MVKSREKPIAANVGDMVAEAMAAAGMMLCDPACRISCETDYLAISGMTFPDVPFDELDAFNKKTLKPNMTEADEFNRYRLIVTFFHREHLCR